MIKINEDEYRDLISTIAMSAAIQYKIMPRSQRRANRYRYLSHRAATRFNFCAMMLWEERAVASYRQKFGPRQLRGKSMMQIMKSRLNL